MTCVPELRATTRRSTDKIGDLVRPLPRHGVLGRGRGRLCFLVRLAVIAGGYRDGPFARAADDAQRDGAAPRGLERVGAAEPPGEVIRRDGDAEPRRCR